MTDPHIPVDPSAGDPSSGGPPTEPPLPRWAQTPSPMSGELTEERLAAYVGPKWETTYRRKLAPFLEDPTFVPTWNWSAALASPAWFLYRKLYLPFFIFFLLPGAAFRWLTGSDQPVTLESMSRPENAWLQTMGMAVYVSSALAAGGSANWFLYRRARAANRFASANGGPADEALGLMARMGGVNRLATALFIAMSMVLTLAQLGG